MWNWYKQRNRETNQQAKYVNLYYICSIWMIPNDQQNIGKGIEISNELFMEIINIFVKWPSMLSWQVTGTFPKPISILSDGITMWCLFTFKVVFRVGLSFHRRIQRYVYYRNSKLIPNSHPKTKLKVQPFSRFRINRASAIPIGVNIVSQRYFKLSSDHRWALLSYKFIATKNRVSTSPPTLRWAQQSPKKIHHLQTLPL